MQMQIRYVKVCLRVMKSEVKAELSHFASIVSFHYFSFRRVERVAICVFKLPGCQIFPSPRPALSVSFSSVCVWLLLWSHRCFDSRTRRRLKFQNPFYSRKTLSHSPRVNFYYSKHGKLMFPTKSWVLGGFLGKGWEVKVSGLLELSG